jgi:primosomal protein N'
MVAALVLLSITGWSAFVFFSPYRKCRWCQVFGRIRMRCRRCKEAKLTRRVGAKHVHKVKLSLQQAWEER